MCARAHTRRVPAHLLTLGESVVVVPWTCLRQVSLVLLVYQSRQMLLDDMRHGYDLSKGSAQRVHNIYMYECGFKQLSLSAHCHCIAGMGGAGPGLAWGRVVIAAGSLQRSPLNFACSAVYRQRSGLLPLCARWPPCICIPH